jgi:ElaB/YqjD/DUF883 family membrane-anchored ribosome-binding protein
VSPTPQIEPAKQIPEPSTVAAERSFRTAQRKVSSGAASLMRSVRRFANERPLQFVGIVAGMSFVAGVALRIWRSNRYA